LRFHGRGGGLTRRFSERNRDMAIQVWVHADPWNQELVTAALEEGADAVIVPAENVDSVRELGRIPIVGERGDLQWDRDVVMVEVYSAQDEDRIVQLSTEDKIVVVRTTDWTIIPLENLVARTRNLFVEVSDMEEAKTFSGILEKGVDGLIVHQRDPMRLRSMIREIKGSKLHIELDVFTVDRVRPLGMGDRVCVDTCTLLHRGEGCLVGNSSQAMFLIHSESIENPYVAPRPFRINAGPVHAYILVPGARTRYLSELGTGDEVLGINASGNASPLLVGRVKIERRPLLLVEASGPAGPAGVILQNAETVRLVGEGGEPLSVVGLKAGDKVLGRVEQAGRHFGHKIQETILER